MDYEIIPEKVFDYLSDIELSIIGYCCSASFLKILGEPLDENKLIAYVREEKWKIDNKINYMLIPAVGQTDTGDCLYRDTTEPEVSRAIFGQRDRTALQYLQVL